MLNRLLASLATLLLATSPLFASDKPNVIFILADDLGFGDVGFNGQKKIKTPNVDKIAAEGMTFSAAYCGTSVCAPSRCTLMTGMHTGHAPVRANKEMKPEGQFPLPEGTYTVGQLFKDAGYATGCAGKWGLGYWGTTGDPRKNGIDFFFGYNCQAKAHEYFPPYVWRNDQKVELDGKTYAQNLIENETLDFVRKNKEQPFFFFYAFTLPHGKFEIDDLGAYKDEAWPNQQKNYAAMVTRMDSDIGRLMALLKELKLDEKTLVMFASDNGSAIGAPAHENLFHSGGGLRGIKRSMYEGGLRTVMAARWPGKITAGATCDVPTSFYDFLPTCAELTGQPIPADAKTKIDGISIAPALLGKPVAKRDYLYWELHEGPFIQAVRFGDYKAVRTATDGPAELYDLKSDPAERKNLAAEKPDVLAKAESFLKAAHVPDPNWPDTNARRPNAAKNPPAKEPK